MQFAFGALAVEVRRFDVERDDVDRAAAVLDPTERARAARYHQPQVARLFVLRRAWLRQLLAHRLGCEAGAVELRVRGRGKPVLAGAELEFSCARSDDLAVIAVATVPVGVDVERVRGGGWTRAAAQRVLSGSELQWVESARGEERDRRFYRAWTRKEAWAKVDGSGLTADLVDLTLSSPGVVDRAVLSFAPMRDVVVSAAVPAASGART